VNPKRDRERGPREERDSEFVDKLVHINRVAKVVKGGRRFGFAALVVVGDQKGRVGFGHGKAREVPEAIRKATDSAKRNPDARSAARRPHAASRRRSAATAPARCICARRLPEPASSPAVRCAPVFDTLGMQDVVAKSLGSSNPYNMVRATFDALKRQDSPRSVAARRSIKVSTLQSRRREGGDEAVTE
jgi:small subunit ribosomal protein S5